MVVITLCKYNSISTCKADNWEDQEAGCSFAVKSRYRKGCMHFRENNICDCLKAQLIAYENYNAKKEIS